MSPALAGGLLTTGPPGKPLAFGVSVQQTKALGSPHQPINCPSHGHVRAFGGPEGSVDVGAEENMAREVRRLGVKPGFTI